MDALTLFTTDAVDLLVLELERVATPQEFVGAVDFVAGMADSLLPLEWKLNGDVPLLSQDDAVASSAVYSWLGCLTPAQAADTRLWNYLGLVTFRDYTAGRWGLIAESQWKNRVKDRWIMRLGNRRDMVRHSIARLWWAAHLSHDPQLKRALSRKQSDPFAYTRVLLGNQDRFVALMERDLGMIPDLIYSSLDLIQANPQYQTGAYAKALMKELTLIAGYRELAFLNADQTRSVVEEAANRVRPSRPKISRRSNRRASFAAM